MPGLPEIEDIWLLRPELHALNNIPTHVAHWNMVKASLQASKEHFPQEFRTYITSIFATLCCRICRDMQEKLPRELQDKIHAFILDGPYA
jgi:hypothetical protein